MAHTLLDSVGDTTQTTGLNDFVLDGVALLGANSFSARVPDGASVGYRCETSDKLTWEDGSGIYTLATNTVSRLTQSATSAAGAKIAFPAGTKSIGIVIQAQDFLGAATTVTLTNKRITARVLSEAFSATPTINTDNYDEYHATAMSAAITSMTTNLTGTPVTGDILVCEFTDNGTARAITWGASFESSTITLPTTTAVSTLLTVTLKWNAASSKWRCVGVA
jgi:hypothetical protein